MQERSDFGPEGGSSISMREYLDVLQRRRAVILQTLLLVLVVGMVITFLQPPVYRAVARLLVDPPSFTFQMASNDPMAGIFGQARYYAPQTQVELLQGSELRGRVARRLNATVLPQADIKVLENTSIIQVEVEGEDRNLVQKTANGLLEVYAAQVKEGDTQALTEAAEFAGTQGGRAAKELKAKLKELEEFKSQKKLEDIALNREAQLKEVSDLGQAYLNARSQAEEARHRIDAIEKKIGDLPEGRSDILKWAADPTVQAFQSKIDELDAELNALSDDLGPANYQIVLKNRQIAEYRKKIAEYRKTFRDRTERKNPLVQSLQDQMVTLDVDLVAQSAKAATLAQDLSKARQRLDQFPAWENYYLSLERQAKNAQEQAEYWSGRERDIRLRLLATRGDRVSVIEKAPVPTEPIRPKKSQQIILAGVVGIFLGLGLALLLELLDDRINSPEEAERVLHLPNLGHVPLIEEEGLRLIRDINTFSPLMESYRSLRTNINFAAVGSEMRSIVITSSLAGEGKSTTAANLAMAMALDGRKVIIVDADLRRPSQHRLFRIDPSPGLTDVLVGTHTLDEALRPSEVDGVWILPAGSPPPNPAELLGSGAMGALIEELERRADFVLCDSPPTLPVSDSIVLSALVDGVLMVIGFGDTKKASTKKAIELLHRANAHVLGTVLNRIESPSGGYYGYGGRYGYGYGYGYGYAPANVNGPATASRVPSATGEPRAMPPADSERSDPPKE